MSGSSKVIEQAVEAALAGKVCFTPRAAWGMSIVLMAIGVVIYTVVRLVWAQVVESIKNSGSQPQPSGQWQPPPPVAPSQQQEQWQQQSPPEYGQPQSDTLRQRVY